MKPEPDHHEVKAEAKVKKELPPQKIKVFKTLGGNCNALTSLNL